jgi:hypothetical protein
MFPDGFGWLDWPNENPDDGVEDEPNEKPDEAGAASPLGFGADEPNENPDEGADVLLGAADEPNENPEEAGVDAVLGSASGFGADDDPKENPDVGAGGGVGAGASLADAFEDEPNEKPEADAPLGDPFAGTAAPNEKAVEGDVEGGLAPNEKANDLAGVDVSVFSSVGLGAEPKLNGLDGLGSFFSSAAFSTGLVESDFGGWPNVNGDEEVEPVGTEGTNPGPEGTELVDGFNNAKPVEGTEGGLGIEGVEAGVEEDGALVDSWSGLQLDFWAISCLCFETWLDREDSVSVKSQNGSSLTALVNAVMSEELSPRIDVQYSISASEASDAPWPLVVVDADVEVGAGSGISAVFGAGVVEEDPNENGLAGFEVEATADWPNENPDVDDDLSSSAAFTGSSTFFVASDPFSAFLVVSLDAVCPKPKAGLCASVGLTVSEPNEDPEAGAPNGEAFVVGLGADDPPKPNEDPVDGADWPKGVAAGVVDALEDPKVKEGVVADFGASAAGVAVAGLPNENPPKGLAFAAAAGAGVGVGAAGVVEAPNVKPADMGWVEGVVDDDWPKEKLPNGAAVGVDAYEISIIHMTWGYHSLLEELEHHRRNLSVWVYLEFYH